MVGIIIRVRLAGKMEKWEDRKSGEGGKVGGRRDFSLVEGVEKWRDGKLFCLVE